MDLGTSLGISAGGLDAQRKRMNVIASNLANASTTKTPEGGPYKRRDVIFESQPVFDKILNSRIEEVQGVKATEVIEDTRPPRLVYDPSHPDANKDGYVAFPNVDVIEEMANMMAATRSYEANITAVNATKSMSMKALEIGR